MKQKLAELLIEKKLTVSIAESCTGGLISSMLTDISGSSAFIKFNVVTYSNEAKIEHLHVEKQTLAEFGAVSSQTASQMSTGIRNMAKTDIGLSITGIAGPTGGTPQKPVGLVFIGIENGQQHEVHEYNSCLHTTLPREEVKKMSATKAIELLYEFVKKYH